MNNKNYSLGIVGVRGYVGKELLALISAHPQIKTEWLSSRQLEGKLASSALDRADDKDLDFIIESLSPEQVSDKNTDIIVLALPNG
ncbi:MAG: N-acetyl-gamma-glutamyl-phosphate reductase, partial [Candidatus Heimdallarchaeota archaeon]|nr:N-acetyl-gamma-glutamyl-phosphate reductase [Candidatus Heimdallarchaeota archaeon]